MKKILEQLAMSILPKLVEKYLTPELIEKYSDKLLAFCKKAVENSENKYDDLLIPIFDALDEAIGE